MKRPDADEHRAEIYGNRRSKLQKVNLMITEAVADIYRHLGCKLQEHHASAPGGGL
jgi:hypothetical protein